jgi:hypothetical protein
MEIEMDHTKILTDAVLILRDRDQQYGSMAETMSRACQIFELITGSPLSIYHANIFMTALKMSRIRTSPGKLDNYVDGINYLAFSGEFAVPPGGAEAIVNAGMRDLVEQMNTQEV